MNKLILFLIRLKLGVKKNELFKFKNQVRAGVYYFSDDKLIKIINGENKLSKVSLNWLFDKECKVESLNKKYNKNYNKNYNKK